MVNNRAFTLVEMLINLMITSLMLWMVIQLPTEKLRLSIENRLFIDQLTAQLNYTQQKALLHHQAYAVTFDQGAQAVRFDDRMLNLPKNLSFPQTYKFYYLSNGRVNQFKTFTLFNKQGSNINIIFQLGSGKFVVQMES